jgi:hypothetical protein
MSYGLNEEGRLEAITDFNYDEVEERLNPQAAQLRARAQEEHEEFLTHLAARAAAGEDTTVLSLTLLLEWIWQGGMRNDQGLQIRAGIACWVFLPYLHALNLTQIASGFGKHKQSWGRWVDDFKRAFPTIKNPHMRHAKKTLHRN